MSLPSGASFAVQGLLGLTVSPQKSACIDDPYGVLDRLFEPVIQRHLAYLESGRTAYATESSARAVVDLTNSFSASAEEIESLVSREFTTPPITASPAGPDVGRRKRVLESEKPKKRMREAPIGQLQLPAVFSLSQGLTESNTGFLTAEIDEVIAEFENPTVRVCLRKKLLNPKLRNKDLVKEMDIGISTLKVYREKLVKELPHLSYLKKVLWDRRGPKGPRFKSKRA